MTSTRPSAASPAHTLSDGVVSLRPIRLQDADDHLAGEDGEIERLLSGGRGTVETVTRYLRECVALWETSGPTRAFAITDAASVALAGVIEVQTQQSYLHDRQVNLAYGVYPRWRGRGFATRAVELACRYVQVEALTDEALIRVQPENDRSAAVALRAGFAYMKHQTDADVPLDWYVRSLRARGRGLTVTRGAEDYPGRHFRAESRLS